MEIIEEIKNRISIGEMCNRLGIEISRSGHAKSIYKEDNTPSMFIYQKTNSYHCFATGRGGDVIDMYCAFYNVDKKTAIRDLASIAGIDTNKVACHDRKKYKHVVRIRSLFSQFVEDMTEDEKERFFIGLPDLNYDREIELTEENKWYYDEIISEGVAAVRKMRLEANKSVFNELYEYCKPDFIGSEAYKYLTEIRGLYESVILEKKLFCIKNYSKVNNHLKKMYKAFPEVLNRSGLVNDKGNLIFYKHRIIIPYLYNSDIVYLRGRYFDEEDNYEMKGNKYLGLRNDSIAVNSPKRFYNMDTIRRMIANDKLFITEGEFDSLAIESIGYNSISVPGAGNIPAVSKFKKLLKYRLVLCGDNDMAGTELMKKLEEILKGYGKELFIKRLPSKDANEFLRA
ncbi:MAG: CHC2 zinc finger domain-containing protein [Ignavibacteriaceae bacterium]|jgi:DNA primase|nr:CHC2 zinc finger domain-containing protein [Ignavibacteriaceae bacterium]